MSISFIPRSDCASRTFTDAVRQSEPNHYNAAKQSILLQGLCQSSRIQAHFVTNRGPFSIANQSFQQTLHSIDSSIFIDDSQISKSNLQQTMHPIPIKESSPQPSISPHGNGVQNEVSQFVQKIWPLAQKASLVLGLDPKILIAQAALETGWGRFISKMSDGSSTNNLFNIKKGSATHVASTSVQTTEYLNNSPLSTAARFRVYDTLEQSFNDYIQLIQTSPRYQKALAYANDLELYIQTIQQAGYATDPHYADKIVAIYRGNELGVALKDCLSSNPL